MRYRRSSVRTSAVFALIAWIAACSGEGREDATAGVHRGTSTSPIIRGVVDDARNDAVVMIVHQRTPDSGSRCTGTLIARNVVATARHCVSAEASPGLLGEDFDPATLFVYVGATPRPAPDAGVIRVVHDGSRVLDNHDFALVVLDRPVGGAIAVVRLGSPPTNGQKVFAVGYGVTELDDTPSQRTHVRYRRDGLDILLVGPAPEYEIGDRELVLGESTCQGDSGGPLMDMTTRALVAVNARGGNGAPATPTEPWASCVAPVYNLFVRIDGFAPLIRATLAEVGAAPLEEARPAAVRATGGGTCMVSTRDRRVPGSLLASGLLLVTALAVRRYRGGATCRARSVHRTAGR